jgi:hypothetical protein
MAGSDLVKVVTHNVTRWRHTHHVTIAPRPTQDIHHVTMRGVHSIHTKIILLRPKQCVCGYGYKRSRCNNNNIKRFRCTWYYQITVKHKLWQSYNISCFNVFGRRLKTMEVRSADCRVWNVAFGFFSSITCYRRQLLRNMWPFQLTFIRFVRRDCKIAKNFY